VIIDDGTQDSLGGSFAAGDVRAMHKVPYPKVIDLCHFIGFADILTAFRGQPVIGFDDPNQGIVVDRWFSQ
jgi:hypothetical protein